MLRWRDARTGWPLPHPDPCLFLPIIFPVPSLGLDRVALTATDYGQSRSIIESLRGLYGEPVELNRDRLGLGSKLRWRDDVHNNSIEIYDFASIRVLNVFYMPLRSGSEKGL